MTNIINNSPFVPQNAIPQNQGHITKDTKKSLWGTIQNISSKVFTTVHNIFMRDKRAINAPPRKILASVPFDRVIGPKITSPAAKFFNESNQDLVVFKMLDSTLPAIFDLNDPLLQVNKQFRAIALSRLGDLLISRPLTVEQILQEAKGAVRKIKPQYLKALQSRQSEIPFVFPSEYFSNANLKAFLKAFPRATKLSFYCENMTPKQLERIVKHYPNLQSLGLAGCRHLTDDAITTIAQSCPNLQSLDLSECYMLTDAAITAIARGCPNLQSLTLAGLDNLTDDAITVIAQSCPHLQRLDLTRCPHLTDAAITAIAGGFHELQSLSLLHCPELSPDKIAQIRKQYPALAIEWSSEQYPYNQDCWVPVSEAQLPVQHLKYPEPDIFRSGK